MLAGAPVITSNDPAVAEVTAGAAVQVDGTSQEQLNAAVLRVIRDPALQRRLRENGRRRACRFSWQSTATITRAVYADAIRSI
jgi:glycosyltransferase involved in cell wall biosynthesis